MSFVDNVTGAPAGEEYFLDFTVDLAAASVVNDKAVVKVSCMLVDGGAGDLVLMRIYSDDMLTNFPKGYIEIFEREASSNLVSKQAGGLTFLDHAEPNYFRVVVTADRVELFIKSGEKWNSAIFIETAGGPYSQSIEIEAYDDETSDPLAIIDNDVSSGLVSELEWPEENESVEQSSDVPAKKASVLPLVLWITAALVLLVGAGISAALLIPQKRQQTL
jgi:hypothetical protein